MIRAHQIIHNYRLLLLLAVTLLPSMKPVSGQICCPGCLCEKQRAYCTPECHPTWGYHQTCWRRFPPLQPCCGWGDFCPTCQTGCNFQGSCNTQGGCNTTQGLEMGTINMVQPGARPGNVVYDNNGMDFSAPMVVPQNQNSAVLMQQPNNTFSGNGENADFSPTLPNTTPGAPIQSNGFPAAVPQSGSELTPQPVPNNQLPLPNSNAMPPLINQPGTPMNSPMPQNNDSQQQISFHRPLVAQSLPQQTGQPYLQYGAGPQAVMYGSDMPPTAIAPSNSIPSMNVGATWTDRMRLRMAGLRNAFRAPRTPTPATFSRGRSSALGAASPPVWTQQHQSYPASQPVIDGQPGAVETKPSLWARIRNAAWN